MATLVAIGYDKEGTAAEAAEEVRRLSQDLIIEPDAVAVITRDAKGEYHVTTSHHAVGVGASWGMFWGLLFGLLFFVRSEEHTSELQSHVNLVCRLLLEKKKNKLNTL